jgi:predicted DNA-binding transcriptional regulator AlpA
METFSTRQAAQKLGIGSSTLARYNSTGKIRAPKAVQIGGKSIHLWMEREIERVRKLLPKVEDRRRTRHQKQARKSTKKTS